MEAKPKRSFFPGFGKGKQSAGTRSGVGASEKDGGGSDAGSEEGGSAVGTKRR